MRWLDDGELDRLRGGSEESFHRSAERIHKYGGLKKRSVERERGFQIGLAVAVSS